MTDPHDPGPTPHPDDLPEPKMGSALEAALADTRRTLAASGYPGDLAADLATDLAANLDANDEGASSITGPAHVASRGPRPRAWWVAGCGLLTAAACVAVVIAWPRIAASPPPQTPLGIPDDPGPVLAVVDPLKTQEPPPTPTPQPTHVASPGTARLHLPSPGLPPLRFGPAFLAALHPATIDDSSATLPAVGGARIRLASVMHPIDTQPF